MEMAPSPVETMPSNSFVELNGQFESVDATDISTQSKDEGLIPVSSEKMQVESVPPTAPAAVLIPSLKGLMTYSGGIVTCRGRWAMSDDAHDIEGQSSEFEFKLVKADADSGFFPINGKYQGWFHIKQAPPLKAPIKVEDKDMMMKFVALGEGKFSINGQGHNRLGKFNLRGTLTNDGAVHIYREYYQLTPVPVPQQKKVAPPRRESIDKTKDVPEEPPVVTPREGAARIRKQSSFLKEFHDPLQKVPPIARSVSKDVVRRSSSASTPVAAPYAANVSERSHRLSAGMKKCLDLLKDLSRLPQAQWFLEPVDPVKFNIPDYPKIIKHPMDFSTIRKNIEDSVYESIHGFAEDMRLVFRNAITYNQAKDSLVNIAARELSNKFEDKFRVVVTQLDPSTMIMVDDVKVGKISGIKRSKSKDVSSLKTMKLPPGPRQGSGQFGLPPAAVDGSTMKILEMQQIIANMQDELKQLRTVVKESEISKRLNEAKEAAQNPLSFEEKKILVGQIHKLSEDKMERVLTIIQEAMPQCSEGVVEIPIDSLDTLTLRKLQSFVQANVVEKKKRSMNVKLDSANKRPRKSRAPSNRSSSNNMSSGVDGLSGHDELNLFDTQDDELLFEPDSFEDMKEEGEAGGEDPEAYAKHVLAEYEKLKGHGNVFVDEQGNIDHELTSPNPHEASGATGHGESVEEDDDDNLWGEAAAEIHNQKQVHLDEESYHV